MNRSTHSASCPCRICRGATQPLAVPNWRFKRELPSDLPQPHGIETLSSRAVTRRIARES